MATIQIENMPSGSVAEDGSEIQLELLDDHDETYILSFRPETLQSILVRAGALINEAQNQSEATPGHRVVRAQETVGAGAAPVIGENKIILTFRTDDGLNYQFAIPAGEGKPLRQSILESERTCEQQGPTVLH